MILIKKFSSIPKSSPRKPVSNNYSKINNKKFKKVIRENQAKNQNFSTVKKGRQLRKGFNMTGVGEKKFKTGYPQKEAIMFNFRRN